MMHTPFILLKAEGSLSSLNIPIWQMGRLRLRQAKSLAYTKATQLRNYLELSLNLLNPVHSSFPVSL